jgi:hypothetical protein
VGLVMLLSLLTAWFYTPLWYFERRRELNALQDSAQFWTLHLLQRARPGSRSS